MYIATFAAVALLLATDPTDAPPPALGTTPVSEQAAVAQPVAPAPAPPAADLTAQPPQSPPPASAAITWAPATTTTVAATPSSTDPKSRRVRAGLGLSVTDADAGFASTFQAGVQLDPWDHFGLRAGLGMTSSVVGAGGWDAAELTGAALFRPIGNDRRVVPYAGLGVQLALLAIFPDSAPPSPAMPRLAGGHLAPMLATADGGNFPTKPDGFGGTNQFKVMPEVTVGALVRISPRLDLDVAARYLPLFWNGTTYNGLSVVASICAPF